MTVIFRAKTPEGYVIKIIAELLQNNIKTAYFKINETGIYLCMTDSNRTILIDLKLHAHNIEVYKFKPTKDMFIGINLSHFHKMLRSIKKCDSIELFINDNAPNDLGIKVIPKQNNRVTTSFIKIQDIQNLSIDIDGEYDRPIIVPSGEFQKMCKGMSHIGNTVNISARAFQISFVCDAGSVMKRVTEFGELDNNDSDSDEEDSKEVYYEDEFTTEQLMKITKLSGLGKNIKIYPKAGLPLLFTSSVGTLGEISIYIKSKTLLERESQLAENSDDEDER